MVNKYTYKPISSKETIEELYNKGQTQIQIAKKFNVSQKVIWRLMNKYNIKTRIPKNNKQDGKNNPNWKGEKAGYKAKHYRIYKIRGMPRKCEECGTTDPTKKYEWASLTKDYDNPKDYKRMCQKCHAKYDKRGNNFK